MLARFIATVAAALLLATAPAAAAPPDEAFSQAHVDYMQAKSAEFLAPIIAKGEHPTSQQLTDAWCRAAYFWKMANPGGEAKLTLKVLLQFRRLQWMCCQKANRAPPLPEENDEDGTPPPPPPTESDRGDSSEGGDGAVEDFMRWHPEEFGDPSALSEEDFIRRRLFWWEMLGEGGKLSKAAADEKKAMDDYFGGDAERILGPDALEQTRKAMERNVAEAERRHGEAEDAEIARARRAWAAANPGKDGDYDGDLRQPSVAGEQTTYGEWLYDPDDGQGPYALPFERLTPEQQAEHYEWERRTADGSVDPLDAVSARGSVDPLNQQAWNQAAQPINVGPNSQVGSGAQMRQQVVGAIAGALGANRGDDMDSGPRLERCRSGPMQSFSDPQSGVTLEVAAQRRGAMITVFARVAQSPDKGAFQAAWLQDQQGRRQAPQDVGICRLYGQWKLSVGWSRSTYRDGALAGRETGGWQQQGQAMIPGLPNQAGDAPDGLWRRLGFSNASRGAQMVSFDFGVSPEQLAVGQTGLVIHITRPGQDPVTTAPFVLQVREGSQGFTFERMPPAG